MIDNTVAKQFFSPALTALSKVRFSDKKFTALPMDAFCFFGCFRHLQGTQSLREHVQQIFHYDDGAEVPVARSTYSDALSSPERLSILEHMVGQLAKLAKKRLPDRLVAFSEVADREVYAVDGSYQKESAHFNRTTPKQGGSDNPKGHMMLTLYDVKMGAPIDVCIETRNQHEIPVFKRYRDQPQSYLCQRHAIWVADRAFVDMPFWDEQNRRYKQTVVTRMKDNLVIEREIELDFKDDPVNEGVISDRSVVLKASKAPWRIVHYRTPEGHEFEFLTNDFSLSPGMVAFLYLRRWDEEKCFDTWKNDFSCRKAWSKSAVGIRMQALLAIVTSLLVMMLIDHHQDNWGIGDEKSLEKQKQRLDALSQSKGQRVPWYSALYRGVSKISRQVIRFLRFNFTKKSSPALYRAQLKPLLLAYL